jgi:hypothetical protein
MIVIPSVAWESFKKGANIKMSNAFVTFRDKGDKGRQWVIGDGLGGKAGDRLLPVLLAHCL